LSPFFASGGEAVKENGASFLQGSAVYHPSSTFGESVQVEIVLNLNILRDSPSILHRWREPDLTRRCYRSFRQSIG
jgi:hypothetical protein